VPLVREDPPIISRARTDGGRYQDIAEKLQADPGSWYRIADGQKTSQFATGINNGKLKAFQPESGYYEAVSRTVPDEDAEGGSSVSVWARYRLPSEDGETLEGVAAEGAPIE
jgi:hypothetical protein